MTTPQNDRYIRYAPSGGTTVLNYDFTLFEEADLAVARLRDDTLDILALGTDYTVTGVGTAGGGTIVLTEDSVVDDLYALFGINEYRAADYTQAGDFLAADVNRDLDKQTQTDQQLRRDIGRCIHLPITDSANFIMMLPTSENRAGKYLGFDDNGELRVYDSTETAVGTNVTVTGGTITGLDRLGAGNILIEGNTISSTNADGNIILSPEGDGYVGIDDSYIVFDEIVEPGTPGSGQVALYAKNDGRIYIKDDTGTETDLAAAGGAGAPDSAEYLTLGLNGGLTNERVLVPTEGIQGDDAGAGGNYTLSLDINGLAADATPDASADYLVTYDASAGDHKKLLMSNMVNGLTADATPSGANDYVMTYDASAGTLKKVLLNNLPSSTADGWVLLDSQTAASDASLTFAGINATYDTYVFIFSNVLPATNGSFFTWSSNASVPSGASAVITGQVSNSLLNGGVRGTVYLHAPASTTSYKFLTGKAAYYDNNNISTNGGHVNSVIQIAAALTSVDFFFTSGNITSGTIRMYGIKS